ncbi:MAG: hypothetical protein AMXMBFR34_10990 [Myxococcaceae bacterium]
MNEKLRTVLAMLKRAGKLTITAKDLKTFLEYKDKWRSMGAAMMQGELLSRYPLEMTMLFRANQPGPLPPEEELWALGRAALEEHLREERELDHRIRQEEKEEREALSYAQDELDHLPD